MENNTWYKSLNRSKLNPPGWVFGVVWPILYLLLAIFFVLLVKDKKSVKSPPLILFIIQIILNLGWTTIFFRFKMIKFALFLILLINALSIAIFVMIKNNTKYLLLPYILWLTFASYLNGYIVFNN